MKYVPFWVIDALMSKKFKCHNCKKVFTHKDVQALGIRNSVDNVNKEFFFMELGCPQCRKATFFEMQEMNILEFAEAIIEEIDTDLDDIESSLKNLKENDIFQDGLIDDNSPSKKQYKNTTEKKDMSKITLKDIREAVKVLKPKELKHENFLEMMGMPPEEIDQYREKE